MNITELQKTKTCGDPVILKANPPVSYSDIKYKRVKAIVMRKIKGRFCPVAVLEDYCARSVVYADPAHIVKAE